LRQGQSENLKRQGRQRPASNPDCRVCRRGEEKLKIEIQNKMKEGSLETSTIAVSS
jgi:hypothetical protein